MANTNSTAKRGQCFNFGSCSKANGKEIIKVNLGDDFVCPECGSSLIELPQKSGFPKWLKWLLIIVAIFALLGTGGYFSWESIPCEWKEFVGIECNEQPTTTILPTAVPEEDKPVIGLPEEETDGEDIEISNDTINEVTPAPEQEEPKADTTNKVVKTVKETPAPTPTKSSKSYSFGKYSGSMKKGIPEGSGTMTYTKYKQIAKHAHETYYAEEGDVFVGTWGNGDIVNGKLFDRNNNLKATILAGKRPNPYDISKD